MVQRVVVQKSDDLDGSEATETVTFAVEGLAYEIDLNAEHAGELRAALAPFIAAGRRVGGVGRRASASPVTAARAYDPQAVRAWAASQKIEIPARGRIPIAVVARFHAAGN